MTSRSRHLQPQLQIALLRGVNRRNLAARGCTLIELMISVAIVGLLSAVALPQFLGARTSAAARAKIGEKIGLAKECATHVASGGVGQQPSATTTAGCTAAGCTIAGCTIAGDTYPAAWTGSPTGVRCLGTSVDGRQSATITVSSTGGLSCSA